MLATTPNGRTKARGRGIAAALALAAAMLWSGAVLGTGAHAQSTVEVPPVLQASELAPPDLLKGPTFAVDDQVPIQGTPGSIWVAGRMSPAAQRQFAALGWTVYQHVLPPWQR
jgi:hypothetical protein